MASILTRLARLGHCSGGPSQTSQSWLSSQSFQPLQSQVSPARSVPRPPLVSLLPPVSSPALLPSPTSQPRPPISPSLTSRSFIRARRQPWWTSLSRDTKRAGQTNRSG